MAAVDEGQVASVFLREVGAPDTPMMRKAVIAWLRKESGSNIIGANPWNISLAAARGTGVSICGERTHSRTGQKFAVYCNVTDGTKAAARLLQSGLRPGDTRGYGGVIEGARSGDPLRFLDALARSKWSADRYGGPANNSLLSVYRSVTGLRGLNLKEGLEGFGPILPGETKEQYAARVGAAIEVPNPLAPLALAGDILANMSDPGFWARVLALLAGVGLVAFGTYRLATA